MVSAMLIGQSLILRACPAVYSSGWPGHAGYSWPALPLAAAGAGGSIIVSSVTFPGARIWPGGDGRCPELAAPSWRRTSRIDWTATRYFVPIGTMRIPTSSHSPVCAI